MRGLRRCTPLSKVESMQTEGMRHPQSLVSLTIVRTTAEFLPNSRIRSVAMFSVSHPRSGPIFALDHFAYSHRVLRADIISDISNRLPRGAALVMAVPNLPRGIVRRLMITGDPLSPADIQLIQRARPDLQVLGLHIGRQALEAAANELAIPLADAAAPAVQRARRA